MGNCDSCVGGRERPSPTTSTTTSTTHTPLIHVRAERSGSFFDAPPRHSKHENYRIIPADDPGLKIPLPPITPPPRMKKPGGI